MFCNFLFKQSAVISYWILYLCNIYAELRLQRVIFNTLYLHWSLQSFTKYNTLLRALKTLLNKKERKIFINILRFYSTLGYIFIPRLNILRVYLLMTVNIDIESWYIHVHTHFQYYLYTSWIIYEIVFIKYLCCYLSSLA